MGAKRGRNANAKAGEDRLGSDESGSYEGGSSRSLPTTQGASAYRKDAQGGPEIILARSRVRS
eukprot:5329274-Pyramimonas_sp.AAC.1